MLSLQKRMFSNIWQGLQTSIIKRLSAKSFCEARKCPTSQSTRSKMPNFTTSALTWLQTILQERFGHAFTLIHEAQALVLTLPGSDGSIRFDRLQAVFHQSRSDFPCHQWQASVEGYTAPIDDRLPAPSETALPNPLIGIDDNAAVIHYDILGLTYWMLTRLEEVGRIDLDNHQRFPATSSHAYQHGYLERPIVDEWLNILGQIVQRIWPQL